MLMTCHRISTWHDRTCIQEQHRVWHYSKPPKMGFEGCDNQYICSKLIIQLPAPYSKLGGRTVMSRIITRRDKICSDIINTMRTGIIRKHIITRDTIHCLWNDYPVHNTFPHCTHTGEISTRGTRPPAVQWCLLGSQQQTVIPRWYDCQVWCWLCVMRLTTDAVRQTRSSRRLLERLGHF